MTYLLSNICTTNYWIQTTKIIVGGWVVSFLWNTVHNIYLWHTSTLHCNILHSMGIKILSYLQSFDTVGWEEHPAYPFTNGN